jgi:glutamate carboxypeptidase
MPYPVDSLTISHLQDYLNHHQSFHLDILRQMVAVNSFTANPVGVNKLGNLTAAMFADLGFTAKTVQSANPAYGKHLILTRPGRTHYKIGLISHLDTVFPPDEELRNDFSWRLEGDRIYGPGTVDIKGGTVMIYTVLAALKEVVPQAYDDITWVILLNAAEEVAVLDFGDVCLQHLNGKTLAGLVFEAGDISSTRCLTVVNRKGMALYRITVEGRAAHAGGAHHKGANAIVQMAQIIQQIAALTDYERDLTFNVGSIAGGTVLNRVPHFAVASGEMRAFSTDLYDEGLTNLLALGNKPSVRSIDDGYPCRINIEITHEAPPWPQNEASDGLLAIWQQAAKSLGIQVFPEKRGGLSDGNLIWSHVPTIDGLGPSGRNAHCSEQSADGSKEQEYVLISSFVPKAVLNATAIIHLMNSGTG